MPPERFGNMDLGFYIIILLLIFLKLIIWVCIFYSRAQRRRNLLSARQLGLTQGTTSGTVVMPAGMEQGYIINGFNSRAGNPVVPSFAPPTYEEAERNKTMEEKPPAYEQVFSHSLNSLPTGPCVYPAYNNSGTSGHNSQRTEGPPAQPLEGPPAYSPYTVTTTTDTENSQAPN